MFSNLKTILCDRCYQPHIIDHRFYLCPQGAKNNPHTNFLTTFADRLCPFIVLIKKIFGALENSIIFPKVVVREGGLKMLSANHYRVVPNFQEIGIRIAQAKGL